MPPIRFILHWYEIINLLYLQNADQLVIRIVVPCGWSFIVDWVIRLLIFKLKYIDPQSYIFGFFRNITSFFFSYRVKVGRFTKYFGIFRKYEVIVTVYFL